MASYLLSSVTRTLYCCIFSVHHTVDAIVVPLCSIKNVRWVSGYLALALKLPLYTAVQYLQYVSCSNVAHNEISFFAAWSTLLSHVQAEGGMKSHEACAFAWSPLTNRLQVYVEHQGSHHICAYSLDTQATTKTLNNSCNWRSYPPPLCIWFFGSLGRLYR